MRLLKTTDHGIMKFTNLDAVAGNVLAEMLDVRHVDMMRTIKRVIKDEEKRKKDKRTSALIFSAKFVKWQYKDSMNRSRNTYVMNEDALYLVVANSQSVKAHELKVWFKSEFNMMEIERYEREASKALQRPMTDQVKRLQILLFEENSRAAPHIYTNIQKQIRINTNTNDGRELDELTAEEDNRVSEVRHNIEYSIGYLLDSGKTGRETKNIIRESLNPTKRTKKARKQGLELVAKELTSIKQQA